MFHLWLLQYKFGQVLSVLLSWLPLVKLFWIYHGINKRRPEPCWLLLRIHYLQCTSQRCVKLALSFSVSNSCLLVQKEDMWNIITSFQIYKLTYLWLLLSQKENLSILFPLKNCIFFVIQFNGLCVNQKNIFCFLLNQPFRDGMKWEAGSAFVSYWVLNDLDQVHLHYSRVCHPQIPPNTGNKCWN